MSRPVALDHNFPEPILRCIVPWLPEIAFAWVRDIDAALEDADDHDLIYELRARGFGVMVTNNWKMENDPRVLVAVEQTRLSLLTLKKAGDDAVFATGVLLRDLVPLLKAEVPRGQIFRASPAKVRPRRARDLLARFVEPQGGDVDALIRKLGR